MHLFLNHKPIKAIIVAYILIFFSVSLAIASNNPPVIQPIDNQIGYKPTEIIIEVEDPENDVISLSVESSDTNVIPQSNLFISGAGANWTLIITPDQIGNSTITVYADDNNGNEVSTSFDFQSYPIFTLPENVTILPGTFSVPLTLNNPSNEKIYGIEFTIDYDPLLINATDFQLSETKLMNNYLMEYNTGISGQVIVCIASNNAIYTGSGLIGQLNFETIIEGQSTSLSFSNARLNEWTGLTQNGSVEVQENQAPSISNIANVSIDEDTKTFVIFTVDDPESSSCSVTLEIDTDNTVLVPYANMSSICNNNTYTLVIRPADNQYGSANITITATDNYNTSDTQSFAIDVTSVNDAPQISPIDNLMLIEDTSSNTISFNISDIETQSSDLNVYASSSDTSLVPVDNIVFGGTDENRTIVITPSDNKNGTATITINVSDSDTTVRTDFTVLVTSVNDLPEISNLADLSTYESIPVTQTVIASDADNQSLTLTVTVSDAQLLPYENISFVGGNYIDTEKVTIERDTPIEIHMTPATGKSGNVTITLKVSDGMGGNVEQSFDLTIKKYQIIATAQGNGQIVPSGVLEVNTNKSSLTFQIQPENGYMIDYLIVDDQSISARPTYTFRNIADNHTIIALFREPIVYTISTYLDNGGNVSPGGIVEVKEGESQTFEIQSQTGFDIDYLKVDGNYVAATNEYTFRNVNESHDLEIFFEPVPAPEADFEESATIGTYPLVVSFTDKSINLISSRTWDFGDGSTNSLKNPQHTYFEPGNYTVTLHVKGPGGEDTKIKKNLIEVYDLQVDYNATPATGAYPLTVTFVADMPESVTHVVWSFGDGETSTSTSPSHVYKESGEYTTQLTVFAEGNAVTIVKKGHINVKGRNISGRITAADTGVGLAGYQVEIIQHQYNHRVGETYTDDNGYYTFVCEPSSVNCLTVLNEIPAATDLILAVWPPAMSNDYYMQYYDGQSESSKATLISTINSDQENIDLTLEKTLPLTIKGNVNDNGVALDNKQVSAYSEKLSFGRNTLTDENGNYTLSGLKASDDYRIYLWDDHQNSEIYYAIPSNATPGEAIPTYSVYSWDAATPVDPTSGTLEHIDIVLDYSTNKRGTIQGQLKIDSQEKAENIWVYAFSEELNFGNGAFTDENGYYTITALSEVAKSDPITMGYIVAVHSIQYKNLDDNPSNLWYTYQAYQLVSDKTKAQHVRTGVTGIDFMLVTQCQITGTVMDIYDTPIPDADVTVSSEKAGENFPSAITDENGKYAFTGLPPVNDYVVAVTAPNFPITYYKEHSDNSNADKIDLSYGNVGNIDFKLDTGMIIRGTVYMNNIDTTAPEGLWVNIWSKSTQTGGDVRTDINGQYQKVGLDPNANDYIISIRI